MALRLIRVFVALWLSVVAGAALAQGQGGGPASLDAAGVRALLDRVRSQLEQSEATLQRPDLRDGALQQLRAGVDPALESLRTVVDEAAPRVETLKARVTQLGSRPAAGSAPESADIARERAERERALKEAEDTLALARTLTVQAEQIAATITDRRRGQFARQLFERSASPLNPLLWWQVAEAAPRDASALAITVSDWSGVIFGRHGLAQWLILLAGLIGAFIVLVPATKFVERYAMRGDTGAKPGRGEKAARAGVIALLGSARPILAAWLVGAALDSAGLLPGRIAPAAMMALIALAVVAAVRAIAQALLAPDAPNWRLPSLGDDNAAILKATAVRAAAVHMAGKFIETINQAIGAGLPLTIATRSLFALLFVAVLWRALSASTLKDPEEEACLGPYVPPAVTLIGPIRMALAAALFVILAAALVGYVALASFLIDQVMWIAIVGAGLALTLILIDECMTRLLAPGSRAVRTLNESVGLRRRAIEQLGVLATGLIKLFLCFIALLLVIAPWGVESTDILTSVRSALFGFKIGDVTVSFSAIVAAAMVLAIGVFLTRSSQRWLDDKFLPRTDLDPGIKNSIRTAIGYAGVVIAGALAISSLGLSLDRVAIIAGALSVGIGFGLQSIVNNFVSGLILLWERPIRVGDLVDVGGEQGVVRRINVRSTEIETFDRATVIMPNSNLVSGVVKNRVHSDRTSRVLISLNAPRTSDPDVIARILTDAATAHPDVMKTPEPRVLFKKIGDATLEFDLVCFVADVDLQGRVSSDLHFAIFRAIGPAAPAAPAKVQVEGLGRVEESLARIAGEKSAPPAKAKKAEKNAVP